MSHSLLWGIAPMCLVVWLTLGSVRAAGVVALTTLSALACAVLALLLCGGRSGYNAVGITYAALLAAAAVTVVEYLQRRLALGARAARFRRLALTTDVAREYGIRIVGGAMIQIAPPIVFAVLVLGVALVALSAAGGVTGHAFETIMRRYAFAAAGGLCATFIVAPALSLILLRDDPADGEDRVIAAVLRAYRPWLERVLVKPIVPAVVSLLVLALASLAVRLLCGWFPAPIQVASELGFAAFMVLNAALIVTDFEKLVTIGFTRGQALRKACEHQVRPVFTASCAAFAFVLPALFLNDGGAARESLALVVAGGTLLALGFALLTLPALIRIASKPAGRIIRA